MGILGKIFTWWNGATVGTAFNSALTGEQVGTDVFGNTYHVGRKPYPKGHPFAGKQRRWVIYAGANDASNVPAEWHGWLHGIYAEGNAGNLPESNLPPPRVWEADYTPNATGTLGAYRPAGALERGGKRAAATGDYEAWSPEGDNLAASSDA